MKKIVLMAMAAATILASCQSGGGSGASQGSSAQLDSVSLAIGKLMGYNMKQNSGGVTLNLNKFNEGFSEAYNAENADMASLEEANAYVQNYMSTVVPAMLKAKQDEYLTKLAAEGKTKTESGLMYEIVEAGDTNNKPTAEDTVTVHYKGTTIDGAEFDSSYSRNEPATFPLNGVIAGWTEGLQLVGKGGKINLYIPSELAYGQNGNLANQLLIFEVELLDITKGDQTK